MLQIIFEKFCPKGNTFFGNNSQAIKYNEIKYFVSA